MLNQLKNASNDIVRHGGSLGLGLAAMGTARQDVYDLLKTNLYQDDAVTGEAAGLALGLVMLGSKMPRLLRIWLAMHRKLSMRRFCVVLQLALH